MEIIAIYYENDEIIALNKITNRNVIVKCNKKDNFDASVLIALNQLINLDDNNLRAVRRCAKTGEYVKVVNKLGCSADEYNNGDILKIINTDEYHRAYYKNERYKYLEPCEYIVLEGLGKC